MRRIKELSFQNSIVRLTSPQIQAFHATGDSDTR
jgi:hypothetical protein